MAMFDNSLAKKLNAKSDFYRIQYKQKKTQIKAINLSNSKRDQSSDSLSSFIFRKEYLDVNFMYAFFIATLYATSFDRI